MTRSKLHVLSCSAFLFVAWTQLGGSAYAGSFKLGFLRMPHVANTLCDDHAYALGQKLQTDTGVTVTDARCEMDDGHQVYPFWSIQISYEAPTRLFAVSTYDETVTYHPGFANRTSCEAALKSEQETFVARTKLPVFTAYCRTPYIKEGAWIPTIIGFGTAEFQPFTATVRTYGKIVGHTLDSLTSMIRQGLAQLGGEVSYMSVDRELTSSILTVSYYARERISLDASRIAVFVSEQICAREVASATGALTAAGITQVGVYCQAADAKKFDLMALTDKRTKLTLSVSDRFYETYEACLQQKDSTVDHYRSNMHRDIKAGYCSLSTQNRFHVTMIERK